MYNPNRVVQVIKDSCFAKCQVAVNTEILLMNSLIKLGSLFVYSEEKSDNFENSLHKISEFCQIDGKNQVSLLIEKQLYSTAMKI